MMLMVPNTISSFNNFLGRFMGLKIQSYSLPKLITTKGYQPKSAKERTCGKNIKANKMQVFKSPFSVELRRMPLIPPAMSCDNIYGRCLPESLETHFIRICWGLVI